jgi:hypothetical protein
LSFAAYALLLLIASRTDAGLGKMIFMTYHHLR